MTAKMTPLRLKIDQRVPGDPNSELYAELRFPENDRGLFGWICVNDIYQLRCAAFGPELVTMLEKFLACGPSVESTIKTCHEARALLARIKESR